MLAWQSCCRVWCPEYKPLALGPTFPGGSIIWIFSFYLLIHAKVYHDFANQLTPQETIERLPVAGASTLSGYLATPILHYRMEFIF